jgi:uncharacterized protein YkwD
VTLRAFADPGFRFDGWFEDGFRIGSNTTFNFTASSHRIIQARFVRTSVWSGADNYRFLNTHASFGYGSQYRIPQARYQEIFTPLASQFLVNNQPVWDGSCFGFTATAYAFNAGRLFRSDYQSGVSRTFDFTAPQTSNNSLTRLIELYQIAQLLPVLGAAMNNNLNNLHGLVSAASNENGLIVGIWNPARTMGHAVTVYGAEHIGGNRHEMLVFDNNQPDNADLRLIVDLSMSGSSAWWFNSADTQNYNSRLGSHISYIGGSAVHNEIQWAQSSRSNGGLGLQINIPVSASLTNAGNVSAENIGGAHRYIPLGVLPLNPNGSSPSQPRTHVTWAVPSGSYRVHIAGHEHARISVLDSGRNRVYEISLLAASGGAVLNIGNEITAEGAVSGTVREYDDRGYLSERQITGTPHNPNHPHHPGGQHQTHTAFVNEALDLVNAVRADYGLSSLTVSNPLINAAYRRAFELVDSFSSTRPDGTNFTTVLREFGIEYVTSFENIGQGPRTPEEIVSDWMSHGLYRSNIMSRDATHFGAGIAVDGRGTMYWVLLIIRR